MLSKQMAIIGGLVGLVLLVGAVLGRALTRGNEPVATQPAQQPPMMEIATQPERWGGFDLSFEGKAASEADVGAPTGGRRGVHHREEGESIWTSKAAQVSNTVAAAQGDPRIPYLAWLPPGESFLQAVVEDDGRGAAAAAAGFRARDNPEVRKYGGLGTGEDADLTISWSAVLIGKPAYLTLHADPVGIDVLDVQLATIIEEPLRKVRVKGFEGILRIWRGAPSAASMYGRRLPTVTINWYEDDIFWGVSSNFLTPEDALRVA